MNIITIVNKIGIACDIIDTYSIISNILCHSATCGPVATVINESIDRLVSSPAEKCPSPDPLEGHTGRNETPSGGSPTDGAESHRMLEGLMTHNELRAMQERIVAELEAKRATPPQEVSSCATHGA